MTEAEYQAREAIKAEGRRELAAKAGRARQDRMTDEERSALGRKAIAVRWENYRMRKAILDARPLIPESESELRAGSARVIVLPQSGKSQNPK